MISIKRTVGKTRDGGSCSECDGDYQGRPYTSGRGRRVLAVIEPGLTEYVNLCPDCYDELLEEEST